MLIGLNPLLGPDLLHALRSMGHGDEIAIVDGNYPAVAHGKRLVRADGHGAAALLEAILQICPVDDMVKESIFIPHHDDAQPCHAAFKSIVAKYAPRQTIVPLVGQAFYDRVRSSYVLVATSEPALYANIIIRKGVIYPRR